MKRRITGRWAGDLEETISASASLHPQTGSDRAALSLSSLSLTYIHGVTYSSNQKLGDYVTRVNFVTPLPSQQDVTFTLLSGSSSSSATDLWKLSSFGLLFALFSPCLFKSLKYYSVIQLSLQLHSSWCKQCLNIVSLTSKKKGI